MKYLIFSCSVIFVTSFDTSSSYFRVDYAIVRSFLNEMWWFIILMDDIKLYVKQLQLRVC